MELPLPGQSWYGFNVCPVGPSLRAVDERLGFDSDMCVPIFPNETHPTGRRAIRPDGKFPYDNCYHWSLSEMDIRVAASPDEFDISIAVKLDAGEDDRRERLYCEDLCRQREALNAKTALSAPLADCDGADLAPAPAEAENSNERGSLCSYESSVSDSYSYAGSIDTMTEMGIFGDPSGNAELQPLVNLWLDFGSRFTKDDIANPVHFLEEIDTVTE